MMTQQVEHPGKTISPEAIEMIRKYAADAEKLGVLHREHLQLIYENNWFNLFVPKEYGGLELNLPEALRIEESLAWIDGSFGWTVTLCAGANWFIGFLSPGIAIEIFTDKKVCLAGSGRPSGIARVVTDGYEVSGFWKYATGALHATIFTTNCMIEENGKLLKDENGDPLVRSFWFKSSEVIIHEDWNCIGMNATASRSFEVKELFVEQDRMFMIDGEHRFHEHPLYKYPFLQFAEATLAVNNSGMAMRFLDCCERIFEEIPVDYAVSKYTAFKKLELSKERLNNARESFFPIVENSWQELIHEGTIQTDLLDKLSEASKLLARMARAVVDELYPYCGMAAANPETEINRVWRNIHTASQHRLLL